MGESLFGKLRDLLSRETKSGIGGHKTATPSSSNLARIGLAAASTEESAIENESASVEQTVAAADQADPLSTEVAPVGIEFFAEVPSQECAYEMVTVSRDADNCLSADAQPVANIAWNVSVTLSMEPVPQQIHAVEDLLQTWAEQLGGSAKGWGLSQGQAA